MSHEQEQLKKIFEGAILAAGEPLTIERMQCLFEENEMPEKDAVRAALEEIQQDCEGRGFALVEIATGWRFQVREDLATWINRLWDEKPQKYSRALLETLALIAYRQPLTRGDIEDVRGVAVSSHIIKTLAEREWVKVVGHRDVPGRPALYATTKLFLDYFNLKSLEELPTLSELKDIDGLNETLDFDPSKIGEPEVVAAELGEALEQLDSGGTEGEVTNSGGSTDGQPLQEHSQEEQTVEDDVPEDNISQAALDEESIDENKPVEEDVVEGESLFDPENAAKPVDSEQDILDQETDGELGLEPLSELDDEVEEDASEIDNSLRSDQAEDEIPANETTSQNEESKEITRNEEELND